jgi:putative endonuclease|tara:strand:+ start:2252 stop:2500 length:249 start_codon:yes stop_codon:yes gene_type:complete
MSYFVYMLKLIGGKKITYVGYTKDLKKRIALHNSGKGAKFTRGRKWKLIYKEKLSSKNKAITREYYIKKNRKLRNDIKNKFL